LGVRLINETLSYEVFQGLEIELIQGSHLIGVDFDSCLIKCIQDSTLDKCRLITCDLTNTIISHCKLHTCIFPVSLRKLRIAQSEVFGCRISTSASVLLQDTNNTTQHNLVHGVQSPIVKGIPSEAYGLG